MPSLTLSAFVGLMFVGQSEAVPFDAEAVPYEDPDDMPPPPVVPPESLGDERAPRLESTPPHLDDRDSREHTADEDMPLRVVGAMCGGLLGFYLGQFVSPLLTLPVIGCGLLALIIAGPAVLSSAPPAAVLFAPFCVWVGLGAVALVLPVTGAIVVGTLGYEHTPAVVGNIGARLSKGPPPPVQNEAMTY